MGILGKDNKDMPGREFRQQRVERWRSRAKEIRKETKGTSIFGGKLSLSRGGLREQLRRASPVIPGSGGRTLSKQARVGLETGVFGKKYGSQINQRDWRKGIKALEKTGRKAPTQAERIEAKRKSDFLKRLGGV